MWEDLFIYLFIYKRFCLKLSVKLMNDEIYKKINKINPVKHTRNSTFFNSA